jgi:hypothetical protein
MQDHAGIVDNYAINVRVCVLETRVHRRVWSE